MEEIEGISGTCNSCHLTIPFPPSHNAISPIAQSHFPHLTSHFLNSLHLPFHSLHSLHPLNSLDNTYRFLSLKYLICQRWTFRLCSSSVVAKTWEPSLRLTK